MSNHTQAPSRTFERYVGASLCMIVVGGIMLVDKVRLTGQINGLQQQVTQLQTQVRQLDADTTIPGTSVSSFYLPPQKLKDRVVMLENSHMEHDMRTRFLADFMMKVEDFKLKLTPVDPHFNMLRVEQPVVIKGRQEFFVPDHHFPQTYTIDAVSPTSFRPSWNEKSTIFWYNKYIGWH